MIIGPKRLLELVREKGLVDGLSERELANPEGAGFDLRLGEVYRISGEGFLGIEERKTPNAELVVKFDPLVRHTIVLKPEDFYLFTTMEILNLPPEITANMKPRSTTFRSGLSLRTGNVAPGYRGKLTFAAKNEGSATITLELGCRIIHVQFFWVDGGGNEYRGQWQGGRISTDDNKERQV